MPFYNREKTLKRAINSVIMQTYRDWELILINDGSIDSSKKIIDEFSDSRIRYIELKKNKGACHARNIGLKNVAGELIGFLDSDNIWNKDFLKIRIDVLLKEKLDFVFGRYCFVDEDGKEHLWPDISKEKINDREFAIRYLFKNNLIDTNTIIMTRRCFKRIGFFDEDLQRFQDWDYFGRLFQENDFRYCFQDNALAKGAYQNNSISNRVSFWDARIQLLYKNLKKIRNRDMTLDVMRYLYELIFLFPISQEQKEKVFSVINGDEQMRLFAEKKRAEELLMKSHLILMMESKWITALNSGKKVEDYFHKYNIKTICIYGFGVMGKLLWEELKNSDIQVKMVLDAVVKSNDIPIFRIEEVEDFPVDSIVVTAIVAFEEIKMLLRERTNIEVISLEHIIDELM